MAYPGGGGGGGGAGGGGVRGGVHRGHLPPFFPTRVD